MHVDVCNLSHEIVTQMLIISASNNNDRVSLNINQLNNDDFEV